MFISVDFPAPFSPTRAWISPGFRSKETPSSASTPGKRLVMARISSSAGPAPSMPVDVCMRVIAVFDDGGVDVRLVDRHRRDEDGRDVLLAVVDLVVRLHRLFLRQLDRGVDGAERER